MVRRTKEDAVATRNSLLDAAERVFYDKGVSRASLGDIAQAAGATRGRSTGTSRTRRTCSTP